METISAVYTEDGIVVPAQNEANSLYQDGYGSLLADRRLLTLKPFEALYLVERGKITVIDEKSRGRLVFQELLWRFSAEDPVIWTRYVVYRDLRTRGFVARDGPGLGVDFLVYERGSYGKRLPRYLIYSISEGNQEPLRHLGEILSHAEESNKILRLAVIDRRGEIVYYTLSEMEFGARAEGDPKSP
jgi:tRNA-intron endonuclease